jgi:aminoglycoside phosphotransferase (APT) family kinase protein
MSSGATGDTSKSSGRRPRGPVPEGVARAVLDVACERSGLDGRGARLWRIGTSSVFRLPGWGVAKVRWVEQGLGPARRAVALGRWLAEIGYPAERVIAGVEQPIVVGECVVTFWRPVTDEQRWAGMSQIGELLRRLHWLEEPDALRLERLDPLAEIWRRLRSVEGLSDDDRAFLSDRAQVLGRRFTELDFVLPTGMVHGEANVGNVLLDSAGEAVLIGLDGFAIGPREWDLVLTALYYERFGWHTSSEYEAFVYGYGFDVMNWYGYTTLADLCELMMTVWLAQRLTADVEASREVQRRISDLRTGSDRHGWQAF